MVSPLIRFTQRGSRFQCRLKAECLSPTKAFRYDYTDTDGNTHVWLVGLVSDDTANYGYAEYIKRSDGTWLGGCSVGVSLDADGRSSALWLESAKQELNINW